MKKLLAAALSGVLTAGIILGGTGLSTKAAETETETTGELTPIKVAASATHMQRSWSRQNRSWQRKVMIFR